MHPVKNQNTMPPPMFGQLNFSLPWDEINWLKELPKDTYFALWVLPTAISGDPTNLPLGHPLYVISFHQEHFDIEWVVKQSKRIDAPIIILNDGSCYDFPFRSNVHFYNYYSWHRHIEQIMTWFPDRQPRNIKYKISAVCHRITQSKLYVFTALIESQPRSELLIKLSDWLEERNIHFGELTGVKKLDDLFDLFFKKYFGQTITIDDFVQSQNYQRLNGNPWQPLYLESALHFTNESYHYSLMTEPDLGTYIRPGPQYSEKTYKCLIAGTPFISVGQFESYKYFTELGFKFDYGDIDLSWDNDPGNLSRMSAVVDLIDNLANYTTADIVEMTSESTNHNTEHLWSGEFNRRCRAHNETIASEVLKKFK